MATLQIKDDKTGQVFTIDPTKHRELVKTRDGVSIRLFPVVIKMAVDRHKKFDGQTVYGPRPMTLISK